VVVVPVSPAVWASASPVWVSAVCSLQVPDFQVLQGGAAAVWTAAGSGRRQQLQTLVQVTFQQGPSGGGHGTAGISLARPHGVCCVACFAVLLELLNCLCVELQGSSGPALQFVCTCVVESGRGAAAAAAAVARP
jgi:hypothetical protein